MCLFKVLLSFFGVYFGRGINGVVGLSAFLSLSHSLSALSLLLLSLSRVLIHLPHLSIETLQVLISFLSVRLSASANFSLYLVDFSLLVTLSFTLPHDSNGFIGIENIHLHSLLLPNFIIILCTVKVSKLG